jgi:DNA repair photolyase
MFVRWSNLTIDEERRHRLPGYAEEAVVRHFDAPEALETRFYEVHARSILNRVPERSRMPFRWTINPYRGCSHACVYCLSGETRVLMADGRAKRLSDVRVGDLIYGTAKDGAYRRFTATRVLDKWSSIKPAYRITLEDGTELVASADHRFLTGRGWKHVTGAEHGRFRRPHLTQRSKLLGPGGCVSPPELDDDYRAGYLCGLVRGDGSLGSYTYERPGRARDEVHRFRLALVDREALERGARYLADFEVATTEFQFAAAQGNRREIMAIRTQAKANVESVRRVVAWPARPSISWTKGFLAGIFDAEGSCSDHALRITNTAPEILSWTEGCLRRLGFDCAVEPRKTANGLTSIRIRGGLAERIRFFLGTDPAITRKRTIDGDALKSSARLGVRSISCSGIAMRLYDLTTGTGDFIANGVVSHNCFARPTHRYLEFDAGRDFEREIVVKVNAPELLRGELARRSWKGEHVAMGTNTDPYQWVEGRYKLMSGIWEAFRDAANPCSVLTKSPLLLRDLGLMREIAALTSISACLSIPTLDEKAWRATEPHTPHPRARLEAVAELNRAGIPTGVLVAPLMPGINDAPDQLEPLLAGAADAGATSIGGVALHLRGEVRDIFMDWLRQNRPELVARYEEIYARGAYATPDERERLAGLVRQHGTHRGVAPSRSSAGGGSARFSSAQKAGVQRERPEPPATAPTQSSLF